MVAYFVMIRLLTALPLLHRTTRLVTLAFCLVALLCLATRSSLWVGSILPMGLGPTRFGSLRLVLRAGCRRVRCCQFRWAICRPRLSEASSTQVAGLISPAVF